MKTVFRMAGVCVLSVFLLSPAGCCQKVQKTTANPHAYITDEEKVNSITTLKEIDPGRLYEMNYTADYRLDQLIESGVPDMKSLIEFIATQMMDITPAEALLPGFSSGCSAYAATESDRGDFLMGRNYDYCHVENGKEAPITAILVRTAPEGGKKSISLADAYWLGYHKGFYRDSVTDLSMLIAAPYEMLDGINEDGFAICVLHLDGSATQQDDPGKKPLWSNVLMRKLIDNAGTVEEAVALLGKYNASMVTPARGNCHFFVADATGDYAVLEYSYPDPDSTDGTLPNVLKVLRGEDCDRYVTNFYVDPAMKEHPTLGPLGKHGLWRYDTLKVNLAEKGYRLTDAGAMELLKAVSQDSHPGENTSHTQWSAVYNLTQKKMDVSILQEYQTVRTFSVE